MRRVQDKVALVTGAASGMGRAEALALAREGATIVVADLDDASGTAVAREIAEEGGAAIFTHLDVTDEHSWETSVETVLTQFGRLDVLVNNAGISGTLDPDLASASFYDTLMRVNARSVFLGIKYGCRAMKLAGGGAIVNITSISASIGQPGVHIGYGASKAAVKSMTTSAAVHHAADGIRVNAVAPGVLPPMRTSRGSSDPAWRAKQIEGIPMKRSGEVQEIADVVLFLASDEASYVTGIEILVDGGLTSV
jgi:NAD(P)-dependent dehydrogenase (short-subunit alcohol dehydrogenase family)